MKKLSVLMGLSLMTVGQAMPNLFVLRLTEGDMAAGVVLDNLGDSAMAEEVVSLCDGLAEYARRNRFSNHYSVMALGKGKSMLQGLGYAIEILNMEVFAGQKYDCNATLQSHLDQIRRELQPDEHVYAFVEFAPPRR